MRPIRAIMGVMTWLESLRFDPIAPLLASGHPAGYDGENQPRLSLSSGRTVSDASACIAEIWAHSGGCTFDQLVRSAGVVARRREWVGVSLSTVNQFWLRWPFASARRSPPGCLS